MTDVGLATFSGAPLSIPGDIVPLLILSAPKLIQNPLRSVANLGSVHDDVAAMNFGEVWRVMCQPMHDVAIAIWSD